MGVWVRLGVYMGVYGCMLVRLGCLYGLYGCMLVRLGYGCMGYVGETWVFIWGCMGVCW